MELVARKADLVRELQFFQQIVERKNTIPILANVLLESTGSDLTLLATDLELAYDRRVVAEQLGVGAEELAPDVSLVDDLAADSDTATVVVNNVVPVLSDLAATTIDENGIIETEDREVAPEFVRNRIAMQEGYFEEIRQEFGDMVRAAIPLYDDEIRGVPALSRAAETLFR